MATTAFEDLESLGEAWHAVGGYGNSHEALANDHMLILLQNHPAFALRCARSPFELFFGPTRELLREVALHLHMRLGSERGGDDRRAARKAALGFNFLARG